MDVREEACAYFESIFIPLFEHSLESGGYSTEGPTNTGDYAEYQRQAKLCRYLEKVGVIEVHTDDSYVLSALGEDVCLGNEDLREVLGLAERPSPVPLLVQNNFLGAVGAVNSAEAAARLGAALARCISTRSRWTPHCIS